MLRSVLSIALIAGAAAFAPGAVLPTSSRNVAAVGPTMQRIGSARPAGGQGSMGGQPQKTGSAGRVGSMAGRQGSVAPKQGSAGRVGSMGRQGSVAPVPVRAAPKPVVKAAPARAAVASSGRFSYPDGNEWDVQLSLIHI